jgi:TatD DNase family protein
MNEGTDPFAKNETPLPDGPGIAATPPVVHGAAASAPLSDARIRPVQPDDDQPIPLPDPRIQPVHPDDVRLGPLIDAHIHLDLYAPEERQRMMGELTESGVEAVIAVSMGQESCEANLLLAREQPAAVWPAFGFHPEQPLAGSAEMDRLFAWIRSHAGEMAAVGEVGLPYYTRVEAEKRGKPFELAPYVALLERFVLLAKELDKPLVLHAVYEDADTACSLLERHGVTRAHFHWFKGAEETIRRMAANGYFVSFTPDIAYEPEIRRLAELYPPGQVMAETDGPWPFEGPFAGQMTHPRMTGDVVRVWSEIHGIPLPEARRLLYGNTKRFYRMA